jgi:S1-C subfamily serine protease
VASVLVLTIGAWIAPRASPTPLSPPQERAAPLIEQQVQPRETSRPFAGVQDLAGRVLPHSVAIVASAPIHVPSRRDYPGVVSRDSIAGGFGVFVSETQVLTHSAALHGRSTASVSIGSEGSTDAEVASYEPATGLVLLTVAPQPGPAAAPVAADAPALGSLAVAVGRSAERDLAVPVFVTGAGRDGYTVGAVGEALLPGMPVFNLGGELFAIVAPGDLSARAIPVQGAAARLRSRASSAERPASFGLSFQAIDGNLTVIYGDAGVLIADVLPEGPGDAAGIRAGDVLLAAGDVPIDSVDTAVRALGAAVVGTPITLRVRRGAREHAVDATPVLTYETLPLVHSSGRDADGPEARVLFPAAVLEQSAIPPTARIVNVNGRTLATRALVDRERRSARRPIPVLVRVGTSQFFAAVESLR